MASMGSASADPMREAAAGKVARDTHRIGAGRYKAKEIHGFLGLIDDGSDGTGRVLIAHVPRYARRYYLDIRLPRVAREREGGGTLTVLATGRHR